MTSEPGPAPDATATATSPTPWARATAWWHGADERHRLAAAAALVVVLAVLLALGLRWSVGPDGAGAAAPPGRTGGPAPAHPLGQPTRLLVPTLDVAAPVVPIEMDAAGVLTPPDDVATVGWWQRSAEPGAGRGQVLVTGHSLSDGDGAMDRIGELGAGDRVVLRAGRDRATYSTTRVVELAPEQVAHRAVRLFGQQRKDGRLVLVTCTDWDGDTWQRNLIVLADRVGIDRR